MKASTRKLYVKRFHYAYLLTLQVRARKSTPEKCLGQPLVSLLTISWRHHALAGAFYRVNEDM